MLCPQLYERMSLDTLVFSDTGISGREGIDLIVSMVGLSPSRGGSVTRKEKERGLRHISGHERGLSHTYGNRDPSRGALVSTGRLDAERLQRDNDDWVRNRRDGVRLASGVRARVRSRVFGADSADG